MGAIASGGIRVLNEDVVRAVGIPQDEIDAVAARELETLQARERVYRGEGETVELGGRKAILVDDGLATGATMRAAIRALRDLGAAEIVVAVPTAPRETCDPRAGCVARDQAIDLGVGDAMMATFGLRRADAPLVNPLLQRGVSDSQPFGGSAYGEQGHAVIVEQVAGSRHRLR